MPDWMLLGKGGLRECQGCGSDEEPCGLEDESIAKNENVDPRLQVKYLSKRSTRMDQAMLSTRKGIEQ